MSLPDFEPEAPAGTPVEVWAPAFDQAGFRWLDTMPPDEVLTVTRDGLRCRLCERMIPFHDRTSHARQHRAEYRSWKSRRQKEVRRDNTRRIRQINRERRLG